MKILHCADLHLDSKFSTHFGPELAKKRRDEILSRFPDMVKYAVKEGINHIIIAGDLFDKNRISAAARNLVRDTILKHNSIMFYYLRGNHDSDSFLDAFSEVPLNLKLFNDKEWKCYTIPVSLDRMITVNGIELTKDNSHSIYGPLQLNPHNFNIVVLHGQTTEYQSKDHAETISLNQLRNKNINYLALGHIHKYDRGLLAPRGIYCYPGCLEGRGFDECGEHGFVVIDIDEHDFTCNDQFVPFAVRHLYEVEADITGCMTTTQVLDKAKVCIAENECKESDAIRLVLTGEVDVEAEFNVNYIESVLSETYFFAKVVDNSRLYVDYAEYAKEATLKGEFVRMVNSEETLDEEKRTAIIKCGIQALSGEDISL